MSITYRLLELLSDMKFQSGNALASKLGVSRTAVWKSVAGIRDLGIDIQARHGKGYRLATEIELLNKDRIMDNLRGCDPDLEIFFHIDSIFLDA